MVPPPIGTRCVLSIVGWRNKDVRPPRRLANQDTLLPPVREVYPLNELSLLWLGSCLQVANSGERRLGEVRRRAENENFIKLCILCHFARARLALERLGGDVEGCATHRYRCPSRRSGGHAGGSPPPAWPARLA